MTDWQPIETAPDDATPVLVFDPGLEDVLVGWRCTDDDEPWQLLSFEYTIHLNPTHWMQRPDPPA